MNKAFRILFAPLLWIIQSCSPLGKPVEIEVSDNFYYDKSKTDIIYSRMGNWFELGKTPLGADAESFEVLNLHLGKDKHYGYYQSHKIVHPNFDLESFDASLKDWMWHIGFDQNHVYRFHEDIVDGKFVLVTTIVDGADPDSFHCYDMNWAKDSSTHYYKYKAIDVDYNSFNTVNDFFASDNNGVYAYYLDQFKPIKQINIQAFEKVDDRHVKDDQNIYLLLDWLRGNEMGEVVNIPYESFDQVTIYDDHHIKSGNQFYYKGQLISGISNKQIEVLSDEYIKDQFHVYYQGLLIEGADAESFRYDESSYSYRDRNNLYREGKIWSEDEPI